MGVKQSLEVIEVRGLEPSIHTKPLAPPLTLALTLTLTLTLTLSLTLTAALTLTLALTPAVTLAGCLCVPALKLRAQLGTWSG